MKTRHPQKCQFYVPSIANLTTPKIHFLLCDTRLFAVHGADSTTLTVCPERLCALCTLGEGSGRRESTPFAGLHVLSSAHGLCFDFDCPASRRTPAQQTPCDELFWQRGGRKGFSRGGTTDDSSAVADKRTTNKHTAPRATTCPVREMRAMPNLIISQLFFMCGLQPFVPRASHYSLVFFSVGRRADEE